MASPTAWQLAIVVLLGAAAVATAWPAQGPHVQVFFANYKNEEDLYHSIQSHMLRQQLPVGDVTYTVLNMGTEDWARMGHIAAMNVEGNTVSILDFNEYPDSAIGGAVIPYLLQQVDELTTGAITVISDSDVFLLHDGWDVYLEELMGVGYSLASINPRGVSIHGPDSPFMDTPEWNWLAYKTAAWAGAIQAEDILHDFTGQRMHDWGHWFKYFNNKHTLGTIHLWPGMRLAFPGKSAVIAGLTTPFAVHCFFGSRMRNENGLGAMEKFVMTHEEKLRLYHIAGDPAITHSLEALDTFALKKR